MPVAVRVNSQDTSWYLEDLAAIVGVMPDYVMLPKCGDPHDLAKLDHQLDALEAAYGLQPGAIGVLPLVTESASALGTLDYRGVSARLAALCFAAEDLASDLQISPRNAGGDLASPLAHARVMTLIAARAAGVPAVDTPFPDPRNLDGLQTEAEASAAEGYSGKLCIHPDQVKLVNRIFEPSEAKRSWARAVAAAFAADPNAGVALVDGKMVDKAHLRLALQLCRDEQPAKEN